MSFTLNRTDFAPQIKCPCCNAGYDIEWDTEYGDPMHGAEQAECYECETKFAFQVQQSYDSWVV
jgi:hypothetical protein